MGSELFRSTMWGIELKRSGLASKITQVLCLPQFSVENRNQKLKPGVVAPLLCQHP